MLEMIADYDFCEEVKNFCQNLQTLEVEKNTQGLLVSYLLDKLVQEFQESGLKI